MNSYGVILLISFSLFLKGSHSSNLFIDSLTNSNSVIQISCYGYNVSIGTITWSYYASNANTNLQDYISNINANIWSTTDIYSGGSMKINSVIYSFNTVQIGPKASSILTIYPATDTEYYYRYTCGGNDTYSGKYLSVNVSASDDPYKTTTTRATTTTTTTTTTTAIPPSIISKESIAETSRTVLIIAGGFICVLMLGAALSWLGTL